MAIECPELGLWWPGICVWGPGWDPGTNQSHWHCDIMGEGERFLQSFSSRTSALRQHSTFENIYFNKENISTFKDENILSTKIMSWKHTIYPHPLFGKIIIHERLQGRDTIMFRKLPSFLVFIGCWWRLSVGVSHYWLVIIFLRNGRPDPHFTITGYYLH